MNGYADNATAMSPSADPVDQVMSAIGSAEGLPELGDLVRTYLSAWTALPGVLAAAAAADPHGAVPLDTSTCRHCESWLVATRRHAGEDQPFDWVDMGAGWTGLASAWSGGRNNPSRIIQGAGPLPGGEPWSEPGHGFEPVVCSGWMMAPFEVGGQVKFVLAVGLADDPDAGREVHGHFDRLVKALKPVVTVWSEAMALDARLRRADDKNKALTRLNRLQGRFVAMASHEFKAPLTSITAYTDVLDEHLQSSNFSHAGEFLGVIRKETGRLLRMVNRILDFTKMEHGSLMLTLQPVNLEPLVRDTVRSLDHKISAKDLIVEVEAPLGLPRAMVDPELIRQVLVNLLHNAVKFTPPGGRITVCLREQESAVAVSVRDNGPGIPQEDIRRIFREFYRAESGTSSEDGTGLGLTIARHIVNLHGGHIEVERRPGGGSDFRFLVPKEMDSLATLGDVLRLTIDPEESYRLVENLLFLLAEMTGSRTVIMLLRDGGGGLVPVGALGLDLDAAKPLPLIENRGWTRFLEQGETVTDPGSLVGDLGWCPSSAAKDGCRMYAPIGAGESALGCVILGRRRGLEKYDQADLAQLSVLTEIVRTALSHLETGLTPTTSALRLLLRIRRNGVPTATAPALALALAEKLGAAVGLTKPEIKQLQLAAVLHDAGMAQVEEEIVLGSSELSMDERDEVNRHVDQVVDILGPLLLDPSIARIIRHHHERFDGTGYPDGLEGDRIPLESRLLAVIDTWFSLTSARPFRGGLSPAEALAEIRAHAGTQLDGRIVEEFTQVLNNQGVLTDVPAPAGPTGPGV
ncbi:MAG: HD domain-containing phosphohydrolase [Candidatus Krumholzibacteriota bacterium]